MIHRVQNLENFRSTGHSLRAAERDELLEFIVVALRIEQANLIFVFHQAFHNRQALAALMGWYGATQATLPPSADSCSQSMRASSERTGGGERTRRTTPGPSSGIRPSTPIAAA